MGDMGLSCTSLPYAVRSTELARTRCWTRNEIATYSIRQSRLSTKVPCQPTPANTAARVPAIMASAEADRVVSKEILKIEYKNLLKPKLDVADELEAGFGPNGLGILTISGVPGYPELRKQLLPLAQRVATLPEDTRKRLEDPISRYSFGWSHGKEMLESGRPDLLKGSFYANLSKDFSNSEELMQRYPNQCRVNLWPKEQLPELESAFKDLGWLIMEVGFLLSHHCDKYIAIQNSTATVSSLESILRRSQCHKGRLLHYFPSSASDCGVQNADFSTWCGWHTDIGSLTGLSCAMYTRGGVEVPCPDAAAGLYIRNRSGAVVKAVYDQEDIAFQIGEAAEILSGGLFHATPHCVQAPVENAAGVERNSFAVFMQPQWDEPLYLPQAKGSDYSKKTRAPAEGSVNFGEFSEAAILKYNYDPTAN